MQEYVIQKETMTLIADRLRVLVGKTTPLTPAEIAYYLERVLFTPQSYASSEFNLSFDSSASGILPDVQIGNVANEFNFNFHSNANGVLLDVPKSKAINEFNLNFASVVIGELL